MIENLRKIMREVLRYPSAVPPKRYDVPHKKIPRIHLSEHGIASIWKRLRHFMKKHPTQGAVQQKERLRKKFCMDFQRAQKSQKREFRKSCILEKIWSCMGKSVNLFWSRWKIPWPLPLSHGRQLSAHVAMQCQHMRWRPCVFMCHENQPRCLTGKEFFTKQSQFSQILQSLIYMTMEIMEYFEAYNAHRTIILWINGIKQIQVYINCWI